MKCYKCGEIMVRKDKGNIHFYNECERCPNCENLLYGTIRLIKVKGIQ